jgi:hypothetical protein
MKMIHDEINDTWRDEEDRCYIAKTLMYTGEESGNYRYFAYINGSRLSDGPNGYPSMLAAKAAIISVLFPKSPRIRTSRYLYDYYVVNIPSDCTEDPEERADLAINEARERAVLYVIPCEWRIMSDDGENVRVVRKRYKKH